MKPLDAALALAAEGMPCFPCRHNKRPSCPRGFYSATSDAAALESLWRNFPGALVGVPTGPVSGIDVLDIDLPAGTEWLGQNHARLPGTRIHKTRRGGYHYLFKAHPGLRCTASKIAPGIDTRASGGYIIWWPAAGEPVSNAPLALWPDWLLRALLPPPPPHPVASLSGHPARIDRLIVFAANAPLGQRNRRAFWAACRAGDLVRAGKLSAAEAIGLIAEAATRSGLPRNEAMRTARSGVLHQERRR